MSDPTWAEVVLAGLNIVQVVALTYLSISAGRVERRLKNGG